MTPFLYDYCPLNFSRGKCKLGLATIVRIVLMYYLNLEKFLNQPDADLNSMRIEASESPPEDPENC